MARTPASPDAGFFTPRTRLLRPRPTGSEIARPRLVQRMSAPRVAPVTTIVAPAGFGKTTLAAQRVANDGRAVAWIALEPDDDTPARFLHVLVAALRGIEQGIGAASLAILASDPPPAPEQVGAALADELRRIDHPWALVIDDAQALVDPATHALLAGLLRSPLPEGHIVVGTRTSLPASIVAAIGPERLVALDAADLRLDASETLAVAVAIMGADPGAAALAQVDGLAHGWLAGTRLLLGRLRAGGSDALAAGVDDGIDGLIAHALDHLSAPAQQALLIGAISPIVCDDLLAALVSAPDAVSLRLDRMTGDDGLLTDVGHGWWRYHPLMRDALLRRFARERSPGEVAGAHRRASAWFAGEGMLVEAVHHALAAQDPAGAAAMVATAGFAALASDRWDLLDEALELLPDVVLRAHAATLVLRCWRDYHRRIYPDRADLDAARALLADPATPLDSATRARLGAHVDAWVTLLAFDPAAISALLATMRAVASRLATTDPGPSGIVAGLTGMLAGMADGAAAGLAFLDERLAAASDAEATHLLGARGWLLEIIAGDLTAATAALESARESALRATLPGAAAFAATRLGWLALRRLDLPAATAAFAAAAHDDALLATNTWRMLASGRAMVALLGGDGGAADALAAEQLRHSDRTRHPWAAENSRSFQARVWMMQRRIDLVDAWRTTIALDIELETPILPEAVGITWIRALLITPTTERLAAADTLIDRLHVLATANRLALVTDATLLCRVAWLVASDQPAAARRLLRPIVERAAARDDLLLLVEHGRPLRPLLREIRWKPHVRVFVHRALAALEPLAARWPDPGVFTPRQREILALLVAGNTFEDIGDTLFLTRGTVRFHASGIYKILGVDGYRQVADRARALGLVPPA